MAERCREGLATHSIRCGEAELEEIRVRLAKGALSVTRDDIEQLLLEAYARCADGGYYPGLTYEEGVVATLRWLLGRGDQPLD